MIRCNQCWALKLREEFPSRATHECNACRERRRGGYSRVGRHADLDRLGKLRVLWTPRSAVKKLGPIPATTTSGFTCPTSCKLRGNGCYAEFGFGGFWWRSLSRGERGVGWTEFCAKVASLPAGTLWRHNLAGDLPGIGDSLDVERFKLLIAANRKAKARGFTFTHKPLYRRRTRDAIRLANASGFTTNVSADSICEADAAVDLGFPAVVLVPHDAPDKIKSPGGRDIQICPAQRAEDATCHSCGWCARSGRSWIVGFRAHGQMKRRISLRVV